MLERICATEPRRGGHYCGRRATQAPTTLSGELEIWRSREDVLQCCAELFRQI